MDNLLLPGAVVKLAVVIIGIFTESIKILMPISYTFTTSPLTIQSCDKNIYIFDTGELSELV